MGKIISNGIEYVGLTNINGVYIDTNNVIISLTEYKPSMTYTATEDCYVVLYTVFGSNTTIYINSEIVGNFDGSGNLGITNNFYLKKGQTISVANASSSYNSYYIVYGVQQSSTSQGSSSVIDYSTTEQKTGQKWIDGNDIYFKTVQGTLGNSGDTTTLISNVANIINIEGVFGDSYMRPVFFGSYNSDNPPTVRIDSGNIIIINNSPNLNGRDFILTLYYTKTAQA